MVGRGSGASANGSRRDWCPPESMASCAKTLPSRVRAFGSFIVFRSGRTMGTARPAPRSNAANFSTRKLDLAAELSQLFGSLAPPTCGHLDLLNAYAKQHVIRDQTRSGFREIRRCRRGAYPRFKQGVRRSFGLTLFGFSGGARRIGCGSG
jgi:hypothetical protein